jgi:2-phosphosulfolactate phosphatase
MTEWDQQDYSCRCEWGAVGLAALATADVVIVVDVLSFSTCVDIAVARRIAVLPYPWMDASAAAFAALHGAEVACKRGMGRYSLSPASFRGAPEGIRVVLPSPNGAAVVLRAAEGPATVLVGCLRNATAVAKAAQRLGTTFNVCAAGERWPGGSLRPAVEDWIGAGAILSHLPGPKSPEAISAVAAFDRALPSLAESIAQSGSGRELITRGFEADVALAAECDVSAHTPRYDGLALAADRIEGIERSGTIDARKSRQ